MGRYRDQCIALPRSWKLIFFFFLLLTSSLPSLPVCFYSVAVLSESSSSLRDLTPPVLVRSINARPVSRKGFLSRKVEISKSRAVDSWRLRAEYRISLRKFRRAMKHCVSKSVHIHAEFWVRFLVSWKKLCIFTFSTSVNVPRCEKNLDGIQTRKSNVQKKWWVFEK